MPRTPRGNEPAAQKRFLGVTPTCQAMTTTRDAQSVGTNQTKKLRLQIFRLTSADLQSREGFSVRHRKVPRSNCLTPNARTQSARGGFSPDLLLVVNRTEGLKTRTSLFHGASGPNDPFAKFVCNGVDGPTRRNPLFLDVFDGLGSIIKKSRSPS
jgi:hypothetical protein